MKYPNSLKKLKELGFKVYLSHHIDDHLTIAKIQKEGREVIAEARCSEHDNFNRKVGRHIALGRAFKQFTETVLDTQPKI